MRKAWPMYFAQGLRYAVPGKFNPVCGTAIEADRAVRLEFDGQVRPAAGKPTRGAD